MQVIMGTAGLDVIKLAVAALAKHLAIFGPTGCGKTTLLLLIACQLILQFGLFLPDLDGRTAPLFFDHIVAASDRLPKHRQDCVTYWEYGMPPPCLHPVPTDRRLSTYELEKLATDFLEFTGNTVGVNADDRAEQIRRGRVFPSVIGACYALDRNGKCHTANRWRDVMDFHDKHWHKLIDPIADFMPVWMVKELWRLKRLAPTGLRLETESTVNILARYDSSLIQQIMRQGDGFDAERAKREGHIIILNLSNLAGEDGQLISQLYTMLLTRAATVPNPFFMIYEEVRLHMASGFLVNFLERGRGRNMPTILLAQSLASFVKKNADLREEVLGQCTNIVAFQTKEPSTSKVVAETMMTGSIPYRLKERRQALPTDKFVETIRPETTRKVGHQVGEGYETGISAAEMYGTEQAESISNGIDLSNGLTHTDGMREGTRTASENNMQDAVHRDASGHRATTSAVHAESNAKEKSHDTSIAKQASKTARRSRDRKAAQRQANTQTKQFQWNQQRSCNVGEAVTDKIFRERIYEDHRYFDGLELSPEEFLWIFRTRLFRQDVAECVLQTGNRSPQFLKVPHITDPFEGRPAWANLQRNKFLGGLIPHKPASETTSSESFSTNIPVPQISCTEQELSKAKKLHAMLQLYSLDENPNPLEQSPSQQSKEQDESE